MAQLLFDALTGGISTLDNQTVLAVQSFLDAQATTVNETAICFASILDTSTQNIDEDDVFLCGKCKKQFTSLPQFMTHKKEQCSSMNSNVVTNSCVVRSTSNSNSASMITFTPSNNRQINVQSQLQVPQSPLGIISSNGNIILSEADLLSLSASFDQLTSTASANASLQQSVESPNSLIQHNSNNSINNKELQLDSISMISNGSGSNSNEQTTMGLSILTNALMNNQLLVSSEPSPNSSVLNSINSTNVSNSMSNMVVTIVPSLQEEIILQPDNSKSSDGVCDINMSEENGHMNETNETVEIMTEYQPQLVKTVQDLNSTTMNTTTSAKEAKLEVGSTKNNQKMRCAYCDKVFSKNFDLQQHIRCHTGEKPFQCVVCGRAFAQKSNVKKHLQTHKVWPDGLANTLPQVETNEDSNNPDGMSQSSTNQVTIEPVNTGNGKVVKVDKTYVCPYCKFSGDSYFILKSHMKQHKIEKVYKCVQPSCGKMFGDLDSFLDHVKTHETEMTYECHVCSKTFTSLYDLGAHQYSHSLYPNQGPKNVVKYYRCERCNNKYSTQAALLHHMTTSTHNYKCPHCEKAFTCERYLRRHLHIHDDANTHVCRVCGKGFKTENYLRIHLVIHSGEKPFVCSNCGTAFNRKDKLKRHMLVHQPFKHLKCPFRNHTGCDREFNRPDKLKSHILTHCDAKPFQCRTCKRTFLRKGLLKQHEIQHENDKDMPFKCAKCNCWFATEKYYKEHNCSTTTNLKRARPNMHYYRSARNKRSKMKTTTTDSIAKKRGRPRKGAIATQTHEQITHQSNELSNILDDGIPTAHIEIITTNESLCTRNNMSQLELHPMVQIVNDSEDLIKDLPPNSIIVIDQAELNEMTIEEDDLVNSDVIMHNMPSNTSSTECHVTQHSDVCKDFDNIVLTVTSSTLS